MVDLNRPGAQRAFGSTFIERMTGAKHAVLRIGNDAYTRHQLVTQVGTGNFRAARILSDLCHRLHFTSVKDLYSLSPYELSAEEGIGVTTLFVLMSLFEAKGLDPYVWMFGKKKEEEQMTFYSLQRSARKRDQEGARNERAAKRNAERKIAAKRTKTYLTTKRKPRNVIDLVGALQATG